MSQKIGTLRLALTFAGCFLGAGYVSGQELWQYFGAFGARGLLGLVLAVALLGGTGVLLLRLSARTGIETMDALIVRADIPWLRTVVGVLTAALLFGVVCIMAAGIGALGEQMLGLPVWLGAAIACVLIAAAAYFGLGGMVSVFTVAVPCMIVAALVIAGIRLHRTGLTAAAFAAGDTNPMLGNWATSAVNYAAYNFFATVGILAPLTRHLKKPGTAVWGTVLGCVLLLAVYMGLAYLGATVSAQYTSEIGRAQLVMAIVEALMGKTGMIIFGIVVGLACVTTAVALTSSAAAYFAKLCRGKVPYKVFVIVICVFSAVVSNLGLDRIVAIAAPVLDVVYPPTLVLIFISLVVPRLPDRISRGAVIGALLMSVLCTLDGYGVPLTFLHKLPLFELGFAWVLPSVLFGAVTAVLPHRKEKAGKAEPACAGANGKQG